MTKVITSNIPSRLDRLPWCPWHTLIVFALGVTWLLDGLEVCIVGAIGPMLMNSRALGLTESQLGLTATAYLVGTVAGAFFFSYLTDRQGRKKWFLVTLWLYLISTLLAAAAWDFTSFMIFRFFAGAGIGGEYAAVNSAIDELIPARSRGQTDLAINGSWWLGTLAGAILSVVLLNSAFIPVEIGWRLCFAFGAVLGVAIVFVRRWVPESPRWLIVHGRADEAEAIVTGVEATALRNRSLENSPSHTVATITVGSHASLPSMARQLFKVYPKRTFLGLTLMITQSILYNAIFFTYGLVLTKFYDVSAEKVGLYIIPFAISNFLGPLLLGRFFDTVGRRIMIGSTYAISAVLLGIISWLFLDNSLTAFELAIGWSVIFFFASAGASSAYLTVSEIFPLEIRAMAIAFFFIAAQGVASLSPWIFSMLIQESRYDLFLGNFCAATMMLFGAVVAYAYGVDAERKSLEEVARPLSWNE